MVSKSDNKTIDFSNKNTLIIVEGKIDKMIIQLILEKNFKNKLTEIIVCEIKGKKNLEKWFRNVKKVSNFRNIKKIFLLLDRDKDFYKTEQKINNFFSKYVDKLNIDKDYLILPPINFNDGYEIEDYLINEMKINTDNKLLEKIEETIKNFISTGLTSSDKRGKKILYSYFLMQDKKNCKYEGISINKDLLKKCLNFDKLSLKSLIEKLKNFLSN